MDVLWLFVEYGIQDILLFDKHIQKQEEPVFLFINKKIDVTKNTECIITHEDILYNDKYCTCITCNYNFKEEPLKVWLRTSKNCPMCRSVWINFTVYTNKL